MCEPGSWLTETATTRPAASYSVTSTSATKGPPTATISTMVASVLVEPAAAVAAPRPDKPAAPSAAEPMDTSGCWKKRRTPSSASGSAAGAGDVAVAGGAAAVDVGSDTRPGVASPGRTSASPQGSCVTEMPVFASATAMSACPSTASSAKTMAKSGSAAARIAPSRTSSRTPDFSVKTKSVSTIATPTTSARGTLMTTRL